MISQNIARLWQDCSKNVVAAARFIVQDCSYGIMFLSLYYPLSHPACFLPHSPLTLSAPIILNPTDLQHLNGEIEGPGGREMGGGGMEGMWQRHREGYRDLWEVDY